MSAYKSDAVYIAFRYTGNAAEEKTTTYQYENGEMISSLMTDERGRTFSKFDRDGLMRTGRADSSSTRRSLSSRTRACAQSGRTALRGPEPVGLCRTSGSTNPLATRAR